jgi:hypothetical protein
VCQTRRQREPTHIGANRTCRDLTLPSPESSLEQLEAQGLHENGRVSSILDAARPWRRGWHPPLVPLAAGRPVDARQDFAHSRDVECPTYHRHRAGDHPVVRFDGQANFLELTPHGMIHECMSGALDQSSFTCFLVVSAACLDGMAPWPILTAHDSEHAFTFSLSADLRHGEPCYVLTAGAGSKMSPVSVDLWQPHVLVLRKAPRVLRW